MLLRFRSRSLAFSLKELLVILAVVVALFVFIAPQIILAQQKAKRIHCVSRLKQIGLSFRNWSGDNGQYPMARSITNGGTLEVSNLVWRTFLVMSNEIGSALIYACPGDSAVPAKNFAELANTNISYFVGLDADESQPQFLLAGDRCLQTRRLSANKVLTIQTNDIVSWLGKTHQGNGNAALSDGSVQQYTSARLHAAVTNAIQINWEANTNATLRLAMPE